MLASPTDRPLPSPPLRAGYEAEWLQINREKAEYHRATASALTPAQHIQAGGELSQQAGSLLLASIRAGHAPKRALLG